MDIYIYIYIYIAHFVIKEGIIYGEKIIYVPNCEFKFLDL